MHFSAHLESPVSGNIMGELLDAKIRDIHLQTGKTWKLYIDPIARVHTEKEYISTMNSGAGF